MDEDEDGIGSNRLEKDGIGLNCPEKAGNYWKRIYYV